MLNDESLAEVDCLKVLKGSQVTSGGGSERDVVYKINEKYKVWEALIRVLNSIRFGINAIKCRNDRIIVPSH